MIRWVLGLCCALLVCGVAGAQVSETDSRIIQLRISDGKILGKNVIRVVQGEDVELRWDTDKPLNVHLHGYDIEQKLEPGYDTRLVFNAYATGRFPITVHRSTGQHGHGDGEYTLVYLEIYPE